MKTEILELEQLLDSEIEAYTRIEHYILEKKDSLIKGDIEKLKNVDTNLENFTSVIDKLEARKSEISSKFGDENLTLKEIIERIENDNKDKAKLLATSRNRLQDLIKNIQRQNKINMKLINHSLKLIELSVLSIANTLVPENVAYNNQGKVNNNHVSTGISSIIREA